MTSKGINIKTKDFILSGSLVIPDNILTKLPAVIFYHGMPSQSKPRYVERAKRLAEKGIVALCFDFRGCGESEGKLGGISFADWLADALLAFDYLTNQPFVDKKRIGIAGKSFGGYMGALVTAKRAVKSMVFHAPAVYEDSWFHKSYKMTDDLQHQRLMYRNSHEALSNKAIRAIEKYTHPLLVIGSELDTICPRQIVEGYYNSCPSTKKEIRWIKDADHPLTDEKHNEEYTKMMTNWFEVTL